MDQYLLEKDIILNPSMKVQSIEAVKKCVMNHLGIAVVPSYSVVEELKNGSLIQIKTDIDEKKYHSLYIYHKNKWLSPQMELALRLLSSISESIVVRYNFDETGCIYCKKKGVRGGSSDSNRSISV